MSYLVSFIFSPLLPLPQVFLFGKRTRGQDNFESAGMVNHTVPYDFGALAVSIFLDLGLLVRRRKVHGAAYPRDTYWPSA